MLVPLLEFCGRDLAEPQGMNTTEQLAALAKIKLAIQSVYRGSLESYTILMGLQVCPNLPTAGWIGILSGSPVSETGIEQGKQ